MERRRRVDPLVIVVLLGVVVFGSIAWWFARPPPGADELIPLPLPAADAGLTEIAQPTDAGLADSPLDKPARTKKGRLLQRELKKKRLAEAAAAAEPSNATPIVLSPSNEAAALSRIFSRKVRGVRIVPSASSGYFVTLRMQSGGNDDTAWVKCSATLSELPNKKLVGSLSSRADVSGEGTTKDELIGDAGEACAASLAQDVGAWVRAHR